jgi:galactokinase
LYIYIIIHKFEQTFANYMNDNLINYLKKRKYSSSFVMNIRVIKMEQIEKLVSCINDGGMDKQLKLLYGNSDMLLNFQKDRFVKAINEFGKLFCDKDSEESEIRLLSVPGRSEIGGNHTDHNHGQVIACAVDLDIIAVVCKNNSGVIRIKSEGFDINVVDIGDNILKEIERYHSNGLVRGVLARLSELGYQTGNGFDAYTTSRVLKGSGLSSSAAFEIMVANIINHLYNEGKIDPVVMAQVSQYAESKFFGKPCGLMDQLACAIGGFITIDFADTEHMVIEKLNFDFASTDCMLCIVNTSGTHSDLNEDYASIQSEMKHVAGLMGHKYLRECEEMEFYSNIGVLRDNANDREILRAIHFFGENARVAKQVQALKTGNIEMFKNLIIESGRSSFMYLQNSYSINEPSKQGISLGLALAERVLDGCGAWRVHGGGFAGTIQAFVPYDKADRFISAMNQVFGKSACYCLNVRKTGACCLL